MSRHFTPHDYQQDMIGWMTSHRRPGVFASMGSGKTICTLTALEHLNLVEPVYPVLILAPLRVANMTWPAESAKWTHTRHLRVSAIGGRKNPAASATRADRIKALETPADIYTMPYDSLDWLVEHCGDNWPFRTVVCDELSRLKSYRTRQGGKRAAALAKVAHTDVRRLIGLTGTPAANGFQDLWGQIFFLDKGERLGRSYSAFTDRWFRTGWDGFSLEPMAHAQREIQERLSDICLTVQGLDVEETQECPIYVDLPPAARKLYKEMERDFFATIEREGVDQVTIEASNAAVKSMKLLQLASGAIFRDDSREWEHIHDEKLTALDSIAEEAAGGPVLVSRHFMHDEERILRRFKQAKVLGADPKVLDAWNQGHVPMLVAFAGSAGHGLNMADGGNILADFSLTWNLEHWQQIIERIGPMRQKQAGYDRPVLRYPIVARGTIDEVVLERLQSKRSVQEVLLAALKAKRV